MNKKIPVTVLSWFLWSWKTTTLKHILQNREWHKVAIIVNDMAELNIDAELIKNEVQLSQTEEKMVEMSNGCICCTLREDLLIEVKKLCESWTYDALIIESSWISEPIPVAQTFSYTDEETGISLSDYCILDTMVTVIDASNFFDMYMSNTSLVDTNMQASDDDTRTIAQLLTEQVECCDIIILNKVDTIDDQLLQKTKMLLRSLQPKAQIIETSYWKIDYNQIIGTWLFELEESSQSAGRIQELEHGPQWHTPETIEYGISSFIYRSNLPFDPEKFRQGIENWPEGIFRAKGMIWLADIPHSSILMNQTWWSMALELWPRWLASLSLQERKEQWSEDEWKIFSSNKHWDRMIELVIIWQNIDRSSIELYFDNMVMKNYDHEKSLEYERNTNNIYQFEAE